MVLHLSDVAIAICRLCKKIFKLEKIFNHEVTRVCNYRKYLRFQLRLLIFTLQLSTSVFFPENCVLPYKKGERLFKFPIVTLLQTYATYQAFQW